MKDFVQFIEISAIIFWAIAISITVVSIVAEPSKND